MRKLMQSPFENDPFCLLFEAFKELYPEKAGNFQAIWNPDINDGFGRTGFEVGRPPLIELNANEPVVIQTETFAHGLAHVAVGIIEYANEKMRSPFCPACGAAQTDEAVEITMRRLEALYENRD